MSREELLEYLLVKRRLVAPAEKARLYLEEVRSSNPNIDSFKTFARCVVKSILLSLLILLLIGLLIQLWMNIFVPVENHDIVKGQIDPYAGWIFLIVFAIVIVKVYPKSRRKDSIAEKNFMKKLEEAEKNYQIAISTPGYLDGKNDFPEKFYNYHDIYRLYGLIKEYRADSLKEAFNLLETQHFQESQQAHQEQIAMLQEDMAKSAKISAAANVVTAYNTAKIAANTSKKYF